MSAPFFNWPAVPGTQAQLARPSASFGVLNGNITIQPWHRFVFTNAAFTAARTWTLPPAGAVPAGETIYIADLGSAITATNTLTIAAQGSDAIVGATLLNFVSAGAVAYSDGVSKWTVNALSGRFPRQFLSNAQFYFVRTDGSDNNTGFVNSAGGAFLTIQKAYDVITQTVDTAGQATTVTVGAGTYSAGLSVATPWLGGGSLTFTGDTTTPANVLLSTSGSCLAIFAALPSTLVVQGFKTTSSAGHGINHGGSGLLQLGKMEYGACSAGAQLIASAPGAFIQRVIASTITGAAVYHTLANAPGAYIVTAAAHTLSGTLAFGTFAFASGLAYLSDTAGYSGGTITGPRYLANQNAVIYTAAAGANYFPGDSAGSTASGGQYV